MKEAGPYKNCWECRRIHGDVDVTKESSSMKKKTLKSRFLWNIAQSCVAILCTALIVPGDAILAAQAQEPSAGAAEQEAPKIPADQLDSLVAPIPLYPDPMLAQVLATSTYPLEIIQLQQW